MNSILLVDDDPIVAAVIVRQLGQDGYSVEWCQTGTEALERMRSAAPDLVLLDLRLPDMSGLDVCARIRQVSMLPIIMISGCQDEEDKVAGLEVGADDYLGKPLKPKELLARVRVQLRRWGQLRGSQEVDRTRPTVTACQQVSVLFADIWNYGAISEARPLEEFADQVSEFYEFVEPIVVAQSGILNNNLSESVVAVFRSSKNEMAAVRAAVELHRRLQALNQRWAASHQLAFEVGVGIMSGEVAVQDDDGFGEFGSMGKLARQAGCIEKLTTKLGSRLLVSPNTAAAIKDSVPLVSLGLFRIEAGGPELELFKLATRHHSPV